MKIKNDFKEVQYEQNNNEIIINEDFKVRIIKSSSCLYELFKVDLNDEEKDDEWAVNYLGNNVNLYRLKTETKIYFILFRYPFLGTMSLDVLCYEPKYKLEYDSMLYKKKGNIDFVYDRENKKILMYDDGKLIKKSSLYIKDSVIKIFDKQTNKLEELRATIEKNEEHLRGNITKIAKIYHSPLENINWLKKRYAEYKGGKNKLQKINLN